MQPQEENPPLTPRRRRGFVLVVAIILALVALIFVGMNLSHYTQVKQGEAVGNASGVPGPDDR